jgi:hypothetical protein
MEQRTTIKFCVKLKKIAAEAFGMKKSAYAEECLWRRSVFELLKRFREGLRKGNCKDRG